jgi:hypothetical protein
VEREAIEGSSGTVHMAKEGTSIYKPLDHCLLSA